MARSVVLINIERRFEAAHVLECASPTETKHVFGPCGRIHGHSYKVEVGVRGYTDKHGMIMNFKDLKEIVDEKIIRVCDHQFLNDVFPETITPLTAENMCLYWYDLLGAAIRVYDCQLAYVRLWETATAYAQVGA